jgi:hypothetical protein
MSENARRGQRRKLHGQAITRMDEIKEIVDQLKELGEDETDGWNALLNIEERATALAQRARISR